MADKEKSYWRHALLFHVGVGIVAVGLIFFLYLGYSHRMVEERYIGYLYECAVLREKIEKAHDDEFRDSYKQQLIQVQEKINILGKDNKERITRVNKAINEQKKILESKNGKPE